MPRVNTQDTMQALTEVAKTLKDHSKQIRKDSGNKENPLSEALEDLSKELKLLATEKIKLENEIQEILNNKEKTQVEKNRLKKRLSTLEDFESQLIMKKDAEEHELSDIKNKIRRIKKVREELTD